MSDLITKEITVRGKTYVMSELDASTAADLRKATAAGDTSLDMLVAQRCCVSPTMKAEQVAKLPNFVVKKLSEAALSLGEDPGAKKRLTPQELFEHRLASLLGLTLRQLGRMSYREQQRWARYWKEEPWGSHRDNLHAAILAVEIRKQRLGKRSKVPTVDDFMLKVQQDPAIKRNALNAKLYAAVKAAGARKKK